MYRTYLVGRQVKFFRVVGGVGGSEPSGTEVFRVNSTKEGENHLTRVTKILLPVGKDVM